MIEQIINFGNPSGLLGVLSRPEHLDPNKPAILIPNTGLDHRVGPHRLHVHICRALADNGFAALRLDLAGMGDSRPPPAGQSRDAVGDLVAAMDQLARQKIAQTFGIVGLCSGADDAHWAALADERIVGCAFIDHYAYPTPRFKRIWWAERLSDWKRVLNFVYKILLSRPRLEKDTFEAERLEYFSTPEREQFSGHLDQFLKRNLALSFTYTGELLSVYNYQDQLLDSFPQLRRRDRVRLQFMPDADHTFSQIPMRRELVNSMLSWAKLLEKPAT